MNFTYEVHLVADGKFGTQERVSIFLHCVKYKQHDYHMKTSQLLSIFIL